MRQIGESDRDCGRTARKLDLDGHETQCGHVLPDT
jgi:hypothetical protein